MDITKETILFAITIISVVITVILAIRKPQEKSEVNDAVFDEKIKGNNKLYDEKFTSLEKTIVNLRDNHIHTIGEKLDKHIEAQTTNDMKVCEKLGGIDAKLDMLIKK